MNAPYLQTCVRLRLVINKCVLVHKENEDYLPDDLKNGVQKQKKYSKWQRLDSKVRIKEGKSKKKTKFERERMKRNEAFDQF